MFKKILSLTVIVCFFLTSLSPLPKAHADSVLDLPAPGTMVNLSSAFNPVLIDGLRVHPENPLALDFILDTGNTNLDIQDPSLKIESEKLIKYFFAALTLPEKDVWVNLSPYEKDRIVPQLTGQTEMGRDMLAQDYLLKQITASLVYPEKGLGKDFWNKIYKESSSRFGNAPIPVNTFNKVWIVADKASVYEAKDTVLVVDSHLKVMLEEDYLAKGKHQQTKASSVSSNIMRQIIIPALETEVNEGKNFANLRQIFHSLILAKWYKETLKTALLNQVYSNKDKIGGVEVANKADKDKIYQQYLQAYKKGVFNFIKDDNIPYSLGSESGRPIARKYFSGGVVAAMTVTRATQAQAIAAGGRMGPLVLAGIQAQAMAAPSTTQAAMKTSSIGQAQVDYYKGMGPIQYEGPESTNRLAFKEYDPNEIIGGVRMEDLLRGSVCYWHTIRDAHGSDPFGGPTSNRPWGIGDGKTNAGRMKIAKQRMDAFFQFLVKLGLRYWTFHDRDIAPEATKFVRKNGKIVEVIDYEQTRANLREMRKYAKMKMKQTGTKLLWATANLFSHERYMNGAGTNPEASVFMFALDQIYTAMEEAYKLGSEGYVFWGGREGYSTLQNTDMKFEKETLGKLIKMAAAQNRKFAKKYGYKLKLYVEPKAKEPSEHQYDFDAETALRFIEKNGLQDDITLNLEPNHGTLAGHSPEHEMQTAQDANAFGSFDANYGIQGWDTDQYINDETAAAFARIILKQGGIAPGGANFDAKPRRASTNLEDIFIGHIRGMDALAHAVRQMYRLYTESNFLERRRQRNASYDSRIGRLILAEKVTPAIARNYVKKVGVAVNPSGQEEDYDALIAQYMRMPGKPRSKMTLEELAVKARSRATSEDKARSLARARVTAAKASSRSFAAAMKNTPLAEDLVKFKGTGYNWTLDFNASTKSFEALLTGEDNEGNVGPIWTNEESYANNEYVSFKAPKGHIVSVEKDKGRFVTDPLMTVAALENTMAKLQKFCDEHGLKMSNIRTIVPAFQQHLVVPLTKQASGPLEFSTDKPIWEQMRDRKFLASPYSAIWRDESTAKQGEAIVAHFGGEDQLLNQTGSPWQGRFAIGHMLQFQQEQPKQWKNTRTILPGSGFLDFVLSGDLENSFFDPGESVSSGFVQVRNPLKYIPNLNAIIPGIEEKLPGIRPTNTAVGTISSFWTKYGLSPETMVVNGTGDNPPQLVGFGMTGEGTAMSLGTSFTLFANIKSLKALEKVLKKSKIGNVMGTAYGKWMKLICFQNGGEALENIRDKYITDEEAINLLNEERPAAAEKYTVAQLEGMDADSKEKLIGPSKWKIFEELLTVTEPGNGGDMMITQNKNESVVNIKYEEGKYYSTKGLDFSPANRAKVLRAAVEGQIYFLKYLADKIGLDIKTINLGGGVAKNHSIRQVIADIFGVNVYVLEGKVEPVTTGGAITGRKVSYDKTHKRPISWNRAAREVVKFEEIPTTPNQQNEEVYRGFRPKFAKLVEEAENRAMANQSSITTSHELYNPGGIDFNASQLGLQKLGSGMDIKFNQAMIAQFKLGNFDGISVTFTSFSHIASIYPLLGMKEPDLPFGSELKLAKV